MSSRKQRLCWLLLAVALSLTLTGCGGRRYATTSWPGMLVDGDLAYVAFNQEVFALDPSLQRVEWAFPDEPDAKTPAYYAAPSVTDGLLVIGGYDSVLYGIDRETRDMKWTFNRATGRYIGSPVVFGDRVFAGTAGNELFALDLEELERLGAVEKADETRRAREEAAVVWQFSAQHGIWSAPLVTAGTTYATSLDHRVYALNTDTGESVWTTELPGAMAGSPLLSDDGRTLYVGNFDHRLYALDTATGEQLWQVQGNGWIWGSPVLAGERLFFGDLEGYLHAVNPGTGEVLWQEKIADAIRGGPVFDPETDRLYVTGRRVANPGSIGTRGAIVVLDAKTYKVLWDQPTAEAIYTSPALLGEVLLVAPAQGDDLVQVYHAETGVSQWAFAPHPDDE